MITGVWAFGEFDKRPITFAGYNIVFNWSFYQMKLELYTDRKNLNKVLIFYENMSKYGEWGNDFLKPIIWMEVEKNNDRIRSKSYISKSDVLKFARTSDIKITIYYEPIICTSTLASDYFTSNDYWIAAFGGLYYTVDMMLFINNGGSNDIESEEYLFDKKFRIEKYVNEDWNEFSLETGKSSMELEKMKRLDIFKGGEKV